MSTFRLPDLGEGLAEAEIVEWHVKVGDHVRVDQPMVSVETAKAVVEVPAPFSGVVTALRGAPGDILPTGAPLIEFDSGTVVGSMPATSEEEFVESVTVGGTHRHGQLGRARAVPAARALAKGLGLDLAAVQGGGRAGLITLDDVLRHADLNGSANAAATPRPTAPGPAMAPPPATAPPPRPPRAPWLPPAPRTAPSSRCAACGAPWRRACRCRATRWPAARYATTPTFITGRSAATTCCG